MRFHTSLPVNDIDATVAFYRVLFEAEPVKTKRDYAKFLPPGLALNISFHERPDAVFTEAHLGFEVDDQRQLDATYARLADAGLVHGVRETSVCCYANQDKFHVKDPSGYEWEIYYLVEDTEQKITPTTACCSGAEASRASTEGAACC